MRRPSALTTGRRWTPAARSAALSSGALALPRGHGPAPIRRVWRNDWPNCLERLDAQAEPFDAHGRRGGDSGLSKQDADRPDGLNAERVGQAEYVKPLPQQYRDGDVSLHLHTWGWSLEGDRQEWCTVLQRRDVGVQRDFLAGREAAQGHVSVDALDDCEREHPVFVCNVEVFEQAQKIVVPSGIRLQRLDACPHVLAEAGDASASAGEALGRSGKGQHDPGVVRRGISVRFTDRDGVDEMIKRRAKAMNSIAQDETPLLNIGRSREISMQDVLRAVSVWLRDESVSARLHEGSYLAAQRLEVLICPSELGPDTRQVDAT